MLLWHRRRDSGNRTASARSRGTIVRSGWNCPGEPAPTASLLISANPGRSLQFAAARCPMSRAAGGIGSEPQDGGGGAEFQPRREQGGAERGVQGAGGRAREGEDDPADPDVVPSGVDGGVGQAQPE